MCSELWTNTKLSVGLALFGAVLGDGEISVVYCSGNSFLTSSSSLAGAARSLWARFLPSVSSTRSGRRNPGWECFRWGSSLRHISCHF